MDKWVGKVALVTGASVGIGANISLSLANAGMIVVGIARRSELIEELATQVTGSGKIHARKCDVKVEDQVLNLFDWIAETLGSVNVLVNNAGMLKTGYLLQAPTSDLKDILDLNLLPACIFIRESIKQMCTKEERGYIFIMNSILGHRIPEIPLPLSVYPASKFALRAIAQSVRQEISLHKYPIKLTSISPGMVITDMLNTFKSPMVDSLPKLNIEDVTSTVLYSLGTPDHMQIEDLIVTAKETGVE